MKLTMARLRRGRVGANAPESCGALFAAIRRHSIDATKQTTRRVFATGSFTLAPARQCRRGYALRRAHVTQIEASRGATLFKLG